MRRNEDRFPVRRDQSWGITPREDDWSGSLLWNMSPWQMMRRMQEDVDRMFNQFFTPASGGQAGAHGGAGGGGTQLARQGWAPDVDVSQDDREWCIEADLPGVNRDDIDVEVRNHHLVIRAEMHQEEGPARGGDGRGAQGRQYAHRERRCGYFERVIPLPENVDEANIRCDFRSGVLTVHVPKPANAQTNARRIPVQDMDRLPSETASGRMRSRDEIRMTEDEGEEASEPQMAGAKGGETGTPGSGGSATSGTGGSKGRPPRKAGA